MSDPAEAEAGAESRAPAFAHTRIDRVAAERHDPAWVAEQTRSPSAAYVVCADDAVELQADGKRLLRRGLTELSARGEADELLLLGLLDGAPLFGWDEGEGAAIDAGHSPSGEFVPLREAGSVLPADEGGLAAYLLGLARWHRAHPFCARCGGRTRPDQGGHTRRCLRCGAEHFPRTDPAVIMLVHDGERLLLGRRASWPSTRYSILAGFVSPGESLEAAVQREVLEESGIVVRDPRFVASQPWPFPSSLMLGFSASADGGEPTARDGELADVRWFSRAQVLDALVGRGEGLALPPSVSIAYLLISRWARGELYVSPG